MSVVFNIVIVHLTFDWHVFNCHSVAPSSLAEMRWHLTRGLAPPVFI